LATQNTINSNLLKGRIIAHVGKALLIEDDSGEVFRCHKRSKLEASAVGDFVLWEKIDDSTGRVEEISERRSLLSRPAKNGSTRPAAANIDQIIAIVATQPRSDLLLLDQYLVISENQHIPVVILMNKTDLLDSDKGETTATILADYLALGYPIIETSAKDHLGLQPLLDILHDKTSILVGQSGVGKSTITNALLPDLNLQTKEVSQRSGLGRHTTTSSTLYKLSDGGEIIDSPGVNIFGLANISEPDLAYGYIDIRRFAEQCRFANCKHINEPKCAVKDAIESGELARDRYLRYLKLLDKLAI